MPRPSRLQRVATRLALALSLAGGVAVSARGEPPGGASSPGAGSEVPLDRLLQIPESLRFGVETRGGATPGEWRARFQEARQEVEDAGQAVARTEEELAGLGESSEGWSLAPPGSQGHTEAPLSYQLKIQLRREREALAAAEKRLQELEIEANLANVPDPWRH